MLLKNMEDLAVLLENKIINLEEGSDFEPVRAWVQGEDGKNRPTGEQLAYKRQPLWQIATRMRTFRFGRVSHTDFIVIVPSSIQPSIDDLPIDLRGGE